MSAPTTAAAKTAGKRTTTKKAGTPAATKASAGAAAAAPADVAPDVRELPLAAIVKHPNNPRHRAIADAEMVESVRVHGVLQRMVVADFTSGGLVHGGKFVLIAGHRRLDAAKKAGRKTVPVEIRHDLATEGQQVEAMLIENLHRQDLTPIEEAEGYHQLELFGYRQHAIAKAMGVSTDTVRNRLKLLKLSSTTMKKVHAGDLTLSDASTLVEFVDDPDVTKDLEKAAKGEPAEFKRALTQARRIRDAQREIARETAKLLEHGATEVTLPKGHGIYQLDLPNADQIGRTHSKDWGQHQGCLGFARSDTQYSGPQLHVLCLDLAKHATAIEAERVARQSENDRQYDEQRRTRERESLARSVAADMRVDTILGATADVAAPATPVTDVVQGLLPILLHRLQEGDLAAYQRAVGIKDEDRWKRVVYQDTRKVDRLRFHEHVAELRQSPAAATRALVAYLAVKADQKLGDDYSTDHRLQLDYLDLLTALGHVGDKKIDDDLRAKHTDKAKS